MVDGAGDGEAGISAGGKWKPYVAVVAPESADAIVVNTALGASSLSLGKASLTAQAIQAAEAVGAPVPTREHNFCTSPFQILETISIGQLDRRLDENLV